MKVNKYFETFLGVFRGKGGPDPPKKDEIIGELPLIRAIFGIHVVTLVSLWIQLLSALKKLFLKVKKQEILILCCLIITQAQKMHTLSMYTHFFSLKKFQRNKILKVNYNLLCGFHELEYCENAAF